MLRLPVVGLFCLALVGFAIACGDDSTETLDDASQQPEATVAGATDTPSPSLSPTPEPTDEPTPTPTLEPTLAPTLKPTPEPTQAPIVTQAPQANCHPSYQGACLDPFASDYDCAGGSGNGPKYTGRVIVVGPDVFGLDRDNDGIGCE